MFQVAGGVGVGEGGWGAVLRGVTASGSKANPNSTHPRLHASHRPQPNCQHRYSSYGKQVEWCGVWRDAKPCRHVAGGSLWPPAALARAFTS